MKQLEKSSAKPKPISQSVPKLRTAAKTRWGLAFLSPSLLGVSIFVLIPFGDAVRRSFFTTVGNQFVGLENFISVLQNDAFQLATGNTLRFVALCIPLLLVLSLLLAVLMQACTVKRELFQASFLLPLAVPAASVALLWRALFAEQGLVNGALAAFGNESILFLNSDATFWVLMGSYLWRNAGYNMVLWLAGLSGISPALYEAARVDGAGRMACFWRITLPCLAPTFFTVSVLSLLNSFKAFREAYLVAGNYPPDSIYLLQHLFNNWFAQLDVQRMCAAAVLMAVVVTGLMLLMKLAAGKEESEW